MSDDWICGVFVFLEKICRTRKCYLIDISLNLLGGKTYTIVAYCYCLFAKRYGYLKVAKLAFELTLLVESLYLLCGVDGIRYNLAEKNLVVAV